VGKYHYFNINKKCDIIHRCAKEILFVFDIFGIIMCILGIPTSNFSTLNRYFWRIQQFNHRFQSKCPFM